MLANAAHIMHDARWLILNGMPFYKFLGFDQALPSNFAVSRLSASKSPITSSVNSSIPQLVWWMTNHSRVPSNLCEMTRERMASSVARPPAFRMTWASPSDRPAYFAGSRRASMQVSIANPRAGGSAKSFLAPKLDAYFLLAASTSSTTWDMGLPSVGERVSPGL